MAAFRSNHVIAIVVGAIAGTLAMLAGAEGARAQLAYVANGGSDNVSVINTPTDSVLGGPIPVGDNPQAVAVTPDGTRVYVTLAGPTNPVDPAPDSVRVIDTLTGTAAGAPIPVGDRPNGIAIGPDGARAYVVNTGSNSVSVIEIASNSVVATIPVGMFPTGIAITPDGARAYVINAGSGTALVIDTATNAIVGAPIPITGGSNPIDIALTPDGTSGYVINIGTDSISVLDLAANAVVTAIPANDAPLGLAVTPNGARVYVAVAGGGADDEVWVIDTATNTVGPKIDVGVQPSGVAITPDGTRAYVANAGPFMDAGFDTFSVVDTATNTAGAPKTLFQDAPNAIAIQPHQGPAATFTSAPAPPGSETAFDGSASSAAAGPIADYTWDFGDGTQLPNAGPTPTHAYGEPGTYPVSLTVTDGAGCSKTVFTGQTAYCNAPNATARQQVTIAEPGGNEPPADTDPPGLELGGKRKQKLDRAVEVRVTCDEPCTAAGAGTVVARTPPNGGGRRVAKAKRRRFPLKPVSRELQANEGAILKLRRSRRARKASAKAIESGGGATARVRVTASDAAANQTTATRRITLRTRGRR